MIEKTYGQTIEVSLPHEEAVSKVKEAFKEQGFGTLTEIDVQATLKEKIDKDIEPYMRGSDESRCWSPAGSSAWGATCC